MRLWNALLLAVPLAVLAAPRDAAACGGCFVSQSESTQVTGHRMIFSLSKTASTLWDQLSYSGDPKDFAWVLPIHGQVEIGLSSDALFADLEQLSAVSVRSPQITCPPPPSCGFDNGAAGVGTTTTTGTSGGVTVIAQQVVGPYETVQLSSKDPKALGDWLANHGYAVPADIEPVIAAYVGEGFDFLALKLVPGQGVSAMRPVRITSPGASPVLPLRMVAAGTGATTPITLWVLGEGRYEPANAPSFVIAQSDLVWDWDTQSSNYAKLKADAFAASDGKAWLVEGGEPAAAAAIQQPLAQAVQYGAAQSGYGDGDPTKAQAELDQDLAKLYGTIDAASLWWTRMHGELSRQALAADLTLGAAKDQTAVVRDFQAEKTTGTPPACPQFPPCSSGAGAGSPGGLGAGGADSWSGHFTGNGSSQPTKSPSAGGCAVGPSSAGGGLAALAGLALAAALRRRRRA
jgi:MYXO-CTERM domain-containing protein